MDLFNKKKIGQLEERIQEQGRIQEMMNVDILANKGDATVSAFRGNQYLTYPAAVAEIHNKYNGTAEWGIWAANIIDVRAAFILGKGLKLIKVDESGERELKWANEFFRVNDLSLYLPSLFVTEAEKEGKFLARLFWDTRPEVMFDMSEKATEPNKGMVKVRFLSWENLGYKVIANVNDYLEYEKVKWTPTGGGGEKTLRANEFIYRKFGGNITQPDTARPKIWGSLTLINDVDHAFRDLREIDSLFGSPVPTVEIDPTTENAVNVAKEIYNEIKDRNWKIKKTFVVTGTFSFKTPSAEGHQMIEKEILSKLKAISGNTGVPVHFLGLPDLMSNRSTAENLMELIWASTKRDREIWESAFNEVLKKSMIMWNSKSQMKPLDPMKVKVDIPEISNEEWGRIEKVWLPLFMAKALTLEGLLERIPELDLEAEAERREVEDAAELARVQDEVDRMRRDGFENDEKNKDKFGGANK